MIGSTRRPRAYIAALLAATAVLFTSLIVVQRVAAAPVTLASTCTMDPAKATKIPGGFGQINDAIYNQVTTTALPLSIPGDVTATATVLPGGVIHTVGTLDLDIQTLTNDLLENQVKPGIVAQGGNPATAFLELTLDNLSASFPIPPEVTPLAPVAVTTPVTGPASSAAIVGNDIVVSVSQIRTGAYGLGQPGTLNSTTTSIRPPLGAFQVTLTVDATVDPSTPAGTIIELHPGPVNFNLKFNVGLYAFGANLVQGGVIGPEACVPDDPNQVLASTEVLGLPTTTTTSTIPTTTTTAPTTTTSTSTSTTSTSTSTTSTSTSTTSTTAPTTTTTTTAPTTTTTAPTTTTTAPTTTTTAPTTTTTAPPSTTTTSTTTPSSTTTSTTTKPADAITISPTTIPQGGSFTLKSSGWLPASNVVATLNSTPVTLGTLVADATGNVEGTFNVPVGFELGAHTVNLSGTSASNVAQTLSASVTVIAQATTTTTARANAATTVFTTTTGSLPTTGAESVKLAAVAMLLLGTGGAIMIVRRRRTDG